jgi:hypothetical protein
VHEKRHRCTHENAIEVHARTAVYSPTKRAASVPDDETTIARRSLCASFDREIVRRAFGTTGTRCDRNGAPSIKRFAMQIIQADDVLGFPTGSR